MRKALIVIPIAIALIASSALIVLNKTASNKQINNDKENIASDKEKITTGNEAMPSIVFICSNTSADGKNELLTFCDKNGNYYSYADNDFSPLLLHIDELIEKFDAGEGNFIKEEQTCDTKQLQANYKTVLEIANNADYALLYPDDDEELPDVEARRVGWYGLYYNSKDEICYLPLHFEEYDMQISANDERANDVYIWYKEYVKLDE